MTRAARHAVFLDRDGVLNHLVTRDGVPVSPRQLEDFRLAEDAGPAVRQLHDCGLLVFVVTNQPDIARGRLAPENLARMSDMLYEFLGVDEVAVCPHDDGDGCGCRKPRPGLLLGLAERWNVDLRRSFVVGDSWKDVEAGRRVGCRTILLDRARGGACTPDRVVATLREAVLTIELELGLRKQDADGLRA
jgi:D-glycero-D-manno-heptose 1,7-bisphosphate phosphatase